jgi:hypothetical protein
MAYSHSYQDDEFEEIDLSDAPESIIVDLLQEPLRFYQMKLAWRKFIEQAISTLWDLYQIEGGSHVSWSDVSDFVMKIQVQIQDECHRKSEPELLPTESFAKVWTEAEKQDISEDDFIQACLGEIPVSSFDVFVASFCEKIGL